MPLPPDFRESIPAELRTADWDAVSAALRRRALFMSSVDQANILQAFRRAAAAMAEGQLSPQEARRLLRAALSLFRYTPDEGKEGTLQDLSSVRRMNVTLETNTQMVHGWANYQAQLADTAYPGQELYRAEQRRTRRDWAARWREAAASVGYKGVAKNGSMIALVTSPVWVALSRFGNPYPPFDFGSGMDVKPVPFSTCQALGLITTDTAAEQQQELARSMAAGPNANVQAAAHVDGDLRAALARELDGVAEFDAAGVLRML